MVQFQCCLQYKVREQTFVSVTLFNPYPSETHGNQKQPLSAACRCIQIAPLAYFPFSVSASCPCWPPQHCTAGLPLGCREQCSQTSYVHHLFKKKIKLHHVCNAHQLLTASTEVIWQVPFFSSFLPIVLLHGTICTQRPIKYLSLHLKKYSMHTINRQFTVTGELDWITSV